MLYKDVLVVDDEAAIQRVLYYKFKEELGIEPDIASSSDEAVSKAKDKSYELCVLDGLYGEWFQLRKDLLSINPDSRVVLFTGNQDDYKRAIDNGFEVYIKPDGLKEIIDSSR